MFKPKQLSFTIFEARLKLKSNDPIKIIFDNIDFSFIYDIVKNKYNSKTYQGYDPVSLFKAITLIYLGEASSERNLAKKLKFDSRLLALCEFDNFLKTPTHATFSNFRTKLGDQSFFEIFHHLVAQAFAFGILKGFFTAADATHIWAYANPSKKSDCDAKFGYKSKNFQFFGYKVHLFVDTSSQLPISIEVTSGNVHDSKPIDKLINQATNKHSEIDISFATLDSAYDAHKIYALINSKGISPIIPLNNRFKKNPLDSNEISIAKNGSVVCSEGHSLIFWGNCKFRNRLKFRCPAALKKVNCNKNCSKSNYGRTFYIHPTDNIRLFGKISRNSATWKNIYNLRSSVERTNSELKGSHKLDSLRFRTLPKVKTHVYFSCIAQILKRFKDFYLDKTDFTNLTFAT